MLNMWSFSWTTIVSLLLLSHVTAKDSEYGFAPYYNSTFLSLNVTGSSSFISPPFSNDSNPQNWTLNAGIGFIRLNHTEGIEFGVYNNATIVLMI